MKLQHSACLRLLFVLLLIGLMVGCGSSASSNDIAKQERGFHSAAVVMANKQGGMMPESLGHIVIASTIEPSDALSPWSGQEVDEGFAGLSDEQKIEWINTHSGYVYLGAGQKSEMDSKRIVIFALPKSKSDEKIIVCYDDSRATPEPYADVDKQIQSQTGHSIAEWMEAASPGAGKM